MRVTKPGGWIELVEGAGQMKNCGTYQEELMSKVHKALAMRDVFCEFSLGMGQELRNLGLEQTYQDHRSLPLGWGPSDYTDSSQLVITIYYFPLFSFLLLLPCQVQCQRGISF
ncbi:hypothetical protein BC936DRAFT_139351 [Jimgerdemannia flammicorona]|uniref:Methyltransferase type 11 domain-containing protein n=1 Tax=Jimgerdemannia flammicorona TaxID=994334 RepID=A0A433BA24_9FUNG|nr:hypothetical protein BC936DRAFT_139351 [Jimgerdemannia flammicorona]